MCVCVVQPSATVPEAAAHVYSVFLETCHIHCWEILYCVPGDFCCCKIVLFMLYLMTTSIALSLKCQEAGCLLNAKSERMSKMYLSNVT